jgi:hypothetical protein
MTLTTLLEKLDRIIPFGHCYGHSRRGALMFADSSKEELQLQA